MLRTARAVAILSVLALAASPLHSQDLVALCKQMSHPAVGSWATFKVVGGTNDGATVKVSVVGAEGADLWIEFAMNGFGERNGQKMSVMSKALVDGFGPGMGHPKKSIVKIGTSPAMNMPVGGPMGQMASGDRVGFSKCGEGKSLGYTDITVPAGTFHALHVEDKDGGEIWVMPSVALGLIKATKMGGGGDVVMTGHGSGAKDELTETPVPFNPAALMQMMGGQNSH
ncbi:MAG TPA: hypothetical protein VEV39_02335 [Gemmatimonadales bacterium]|nr:hypothetical protein [Gemmatimonadales bacterium]